MCSGLLWMQGWFFRSGVCRRPRTLQEHVLTSPILAKYLHSRALKTKRKYSKWGCHLHQTIENASWLSFCFNLQSESNGKQPLFKMQLWISSELYSVFQYHTDASSRCTEQPVGEGLQQRCRIRKHKTLCVKHVFCPWFRPTGKQTICTSFTKWSKTNAGL